MEISLENLYGDQYSQTLLIWTLKGPQKVSVLRASCYYVKKHYLLKQHTKEIKEDISIVKLNIFNSHKVVIRLTKCPGTLNKTLIYYYLIKTVLL